MSTLQETDGSNQFVSSSEVTFRSTMTVEMIDTMGGDARVVAAARVSTAGQTHRLTAVKLLPDSTENKLINYLMRDRHGSPFEHSLATYYIEAPIFVWREIMRHRIVSYNEESGRYRQLRPTFYIPGSDRHLQQTGRPGRYVFVDGTPEQSNLVDSVGRRIARLAYAAYEKQLTDGVAREVARMVLPTSIYSSAYMTLNARSLMNFLSLRVKAEDAAFPSYPQREIEMVAQQMEDQWAAWMPLTHQAFLANRRVAP